MREGEWSEKRGVMLIGRIDADEADIRLDSSVRCLEMD